MFEISEGTQSDGIRATLRNFALKILSRSIFRIPWSAAEELDLP
jgi:hypothetical protein